jgi:hypothetical protein
MITQNALFSSANQAPIRAYIAGATWRHERNGHIAILRKGPITFKGTVSRDFLLLAFLMNQFPP